jgi:hypothetical protein
MLFQNIGTYGVTTEKTSIENLLSSMTSKMDLTEIGFGDVGWIDLAQDRDRWRALVNTVMNLRVP